ncbi:MAG TPA: hypothetical protein ENI69_07345 [Rhodospirillales bacterium]|nr:hypothetical protein [Rhodospirillales bacterium]
MRYQVRFDDQIDQWMVIDTRVGDRVIQRYKTRYEARHGAWDQEERWYKCSGEGNSEALVGVG